MKSVTLYFADDDDARNFEKYRQLALENHGTVTGLYAGLMTSLIRDAKVTENHAPELLDALKGWFHTQTTEERIAWMQAARATIEKAEG